MQTGSAMRAVQVSTDTFAAIWADRRPGEDSEDAILRRKFGVNAPLPDIRRISGRPLAVEGYYDRRFNIPFAEGFEIFRHYKGSDYHAKATSGAWLLLNTGDLYNTLNRLSEAIGAHEDAWHGWRYRDNDGNVHLINKLRDQNKITKRHKK